MTRLTVVALGVFAALAAPPAGAATGCNLWAHVSDPDARGTNVRAAPNSKARVLATLKKVKGRLPVVRVTAQQGAWFRISSAETGGGKAKRLSGWIHRSLLAVQLRGGAPMYAGPSRRRKLPYHAGDAEADGKLLACRGTWVRVYHTELKKRGWMSQDDHCPDMGTPCS